MSKCKKKQMSTSNFGSIVGQFLGENQKMKIKYLYSGLVPFPVKLQVKSKNKKSSPIADAGLLSGQILVRKRPWSEKS